VLALTVTVATGALAATASAQGPTYAPQTPTLGALYRDGQTGRYLLGGTWLYRPDLSNVGLAQGWWRNNSSTTGWTPVTIPDSYNAGDFSTLSDTGYVGWYRADFTLPKGAFASYVPRSGQHWILRFESVNYRATVWLNGRQIGTHAGAYLPWELDLNNLRAGVNRLIVRVDDRRGPSDLPPGPTGGWWNFGGINREVYLRRVQEADISQVQIRPILPCPTCAATINDQVLVRDVTSSPLTVRLRGTYGPVHLSFGSATIPPHGTWTAQASAALAHPHLWAPGSPYLYKATLTLSDSRARALGGYTDYSGVRSITTVGGHLELNGRLLNLRGVDLHEQDITEGAALTPADLARLMGWVRELGATVIRSHYPLGPEFEELADRDGILLWSEIPVYQVQSKYLAEPSVLSQADSMLEQNILDNQNHPSVLLWSIGNELATPADAPEAHYIETAAALVHQLDPTRPVGMATSDWPGVPCQSAYAPLDLLGFNDYFGWFDAGGGTTDDRDALSPFLDTWRACYPSKALFISEFGFDGNRNGPVEERGTYAFQSDSAAFHLGVFATKPWLSGAIYWLLQDFAAAPGFTGGDPWPDPPFVQKGLVDLYGNLKPAFSVVQSIYKSTVQIAPARDVKSSDTNQKAKRSSATKSPKSGTATRSRLL
jgi:Glycosyl hydrolases family 2, TIM barrel domain/Glycosyl hydrolases family 2, sugar binding domain/Glycosyl hydrolases family 2